MTILHCATLTMTPAPPSKKPKVSARRWKRGKHCAHDKCPAFSMCDVKQDRSSEHDRHSDRVHQLMAGSGEPAPVDLAKFRKRVGEIIAGAMQALRIRRKKSD